MTLSSILRDVYFNRVPALLLNAFVGSDEMEVVLGMAGDVPSHVRHVTLYSSGILPRHYVINSESRRMMYTSAELAAEVVNGLFAQGIPAEAVGNLACATPYPNQTMPGHGVMVHGLLDILPRGVFNMAGVYAAGMAAMRYVYSAVRTGEHAHAVSVASKSVSAVIRGEVFQSETDYKKLENASPEIGFKKDFLRWTLSDGTDTVYLSDRPNSDGLNLKIRWIGLLSYVNEMSPCMYTSTKFRDGIFEGWKHVDADYGRHHSLTVVKQDVELSSGNIVRYVVGKPLSQIAARRDTRTKKINWFLPHYSSGSFRDCLSDGLKNIGFDIPQEKWFTNPHGKGSTGSASIYITLEELIYTFPIEHDQKILCYVPKNRRLSTCFMLLEVVEAV